MPFRTNAQRYFLTWSQAPQIDADELADYLHSLDDTNWVELCREHHADLGIHYHAVVVFTARFQRPLNVFDFADRTADIASIKNGTTDLARCRHYIRKGDRTKEEEHDIKSHKKTTCDYDADVIVRGDPPEYVTETGRMSWNEILHASTCPADFLKLAEQHYCGEFILRHRQILEFAELKWTARQGQDQPEHARETFIVPPELDDWVEQVLSEVSFVSIYVSRTLTGTLFIDDSGIEY